MQIVIQETLEDSFSASIDWLISQTVTVLVLSNLESSIHQYNELQLLWVWLHKLWQYVRYNIVCFAVLTFSAYLHFLESEKDTSIYISLEKFQLFIYIVILNKRCV